MKLQTTSRYWVAALTLTMASCSTSNSSGPTGPSTAVQPARVSAGDGVVSTQAEGDVKVGSGPLEILRLRMDRQTTAGVSVLRQFALPKGSYAMGVNETIELWAEYPSEVVNPRFRVDWGDGIVDAIGCGSCLIKHTYPRAGVFTVRASLDDRVSTTVTRTFVLDSSIAAPSPTPTVGPGASGSQTFAFTGSAETFTVPAGVTSVTIEAWGAQGGTATDNGDPGGLGAYIKGTFTVTPGQTLTVVVGRRGNDNPSTSGGGGGSGVSSGGAPLLVAGAGAGIDSQDPGYVGKDGQTSTSGANGNGGGGAGGTAGGDGGLTIYSGSNIAYGGRGFNAGASGSTGQNGTSSNTTVTNGVFGLGGGGGSVAAGWCNCGGGGGGYSGGGAGEINTSGGGGGSFNGGTSQTNTSGVRTGDGQVKITW